MRKSKPTSRMVRKHRLYTYAELSRALGVHKRTIRKWVETEGLPVIDDQRPHMFEGSEVKLFLDQRNEKRKQPCPLGHIFCFKCKTPRRPAMNALDYAPSNIGAGMIYGLCERCLTLMSQRIGHADLALKWPNAEVKIKH